MDQIKQKFVVLCSVMLAVLFGFGCNDDVTESGNPEDISIEAPENPGTVHRLAQMIAASTVSGEGRSFIKEEVAKQFDGDYNFLFAEAISKPVTGSGTLKSTGSSDESYGNFLAKYAKSESGLKSTSTDMTDFYATLEEEFPLLQVAIPFYDEESTKVWENGVKPLVAVLDPDYDEQTTETIVAYDSDGNVHTLDATEAPDVPVIVISPNERLVAVPKTGLKSMFFRGPIYFETRTHVYYFKQMDDLYIGDPRPYIPIAIQNPSIVTYDRDLNSAKDYLSQAKFVNKDAARQVEGWPAGNPEFKVVIVYASKEGTNPTTTKIEKFPTDDGWIKKKFFTIDVVTKSLNIPILTWFPDRIGRDIIYQWIEQDGGPETKEINLTLNTKFDDNTTTSLSTKLTMGSRDEEAGSAVVQYEDSTDGIGTEYNTGIVQFWVNQQ